MFPIISKGTMADPDASIIDSTGLSKDANSVPEVWIANSLEKYRLVYDYQVSRRGGKTMPGGIVVDFVVYSGIVTAVEFLGVYWHTGRFGINDALKWSYLARVYDRVLLLADEPLPAMGGWVATEVVVDQNSSDRAIRKYFI